MKSKIKFFVIAIITTKEISHDSFICWILNWLNIPQSQENIDVRNFAKNFLRQIIKESKNKELEKLLEKDFDKVASALEKKGVDNALLNSLKELAQRTKEKRQRSNKTCS